MPLSEKKSKENRDYVPRWDFPHAHMLITPQAVGESEDFRARPEPMCLINGCYFKLYFCVSLMV